MVEYAQHAQPLPSPLSSAAFMLAAPQRSSGKTTIAIGLIRALTERGLNVQPFKKGPDYIDGLWLARAATHACFNLDFHQQSIEDIQATWHHNESNVRVVEANQGLHDGLSLDGSDSNAALARHLDIPVVLVINTRGMNRGVAALVQGLCGFDSQIRFAGVILNFVQGPRHEKKLVQAIDAYTDLGVLGCVSRDEQMVISEQQLGLVPSCEVSQSGELIARMCEQIVEGCDIDKLLECCSKSDTPVPMSMTPRNRHALNVISGEAKKKVLCSEEHPRLNIGVLRDEAFCFYYEDDLARFTDLNVNLSFIDALHDSSAGRIDGLFIGGGFPERYLDELQNNNTLRIHLRDLINGGLPVYAECGGLMYLCRSISNQDQTAKMLSVIPADVQMTQKPVGRGYVTLRATQHMPWPYTDVAPNVPAHEFHYSTLTAVDESRFAYDVLRGQGIKNKQDGFLIHNVIASYAHQRHSSLNPWVDAFVAYVTQIKATVQSHRNQVQ